MKSRADIVNDPKKESFLDFPSDIQRVIPSVARDAEATKIKRKLSMSCKSLYCFFQLDLDKSDAQRLLSYVLQGNAAEAKKMYEANPRLLFIEATAQEYAAGLDEHGEPVYRMETESPFKAAARAGDIWLLKDMKEQFGKVLNQSSDKRFDTLAEAQLAEVFPAGFEYPPSTYDFKDLVQAITHDPILINATHFVKPGQASPNTEKVLAEFRKDFLPGSKKVGYHFNLNELIKACEIYNSNYSQWNPYQAAVFWGQVVGYLERLVSACDAQALCQGIKNILDGKPLERSFNLDLYVNNEEKKISYYPLVVDPSCYLGGTFAVDSCWRAVGCGRLVWGSAVGLAAWLKNYVDQKQQDLKSLSNSCTNQLTSQK